MARVRVICKVPPAVGVIRNGRLPDATDVDVFVVGDDGKEERLSGVSWIRWEAKEGCENRLTMMLCDADVDLEAEVEPAMLVPPQPEPEPLKLRPGVVPPGGVPEDL